MIISFMQALEKKKNNDVHNNNSNNKISETKNIKKNIKAQTTKKYAIAFISSSLTRAQSAHTLTRVF